MSSIDGFASYTRHLPHWRLKGAAYFVTWRLAKGHPDLTVEEREIVWNALRFFDGVRYVLAATSTLWSYRKNRARDRKSVV